MSTKVLYVISNIHKALAFEWIATFTNKEKIELGFVLLNKQNSELENYLVGNGFPVKRITCTSKRHIPRAIVSTISFISKFKPSVVHTHLFDANIIGLLAGFICRISKRIYTRHHSTYHHEYFPKAVKYDLFCNNLSTKIIAISETVEEILINKEKVPTGKIKLIHHGFKLDEFVNVKSEDIRLLEIKYNTIDFYPVIGTISRYTEWKGVQYTIVAFEKLLTKYPNAKLLLANAEGDYTSDIKKLLLRIPKRNYTEIEFENNLFALYKLFNVYVHVPIDEHSEAFGQTYVEALASSIPCVFTLSGIANEFIRHNYNALVVEYKNPIAIYNSICTLLNDSQLTQILIKNGKADVEKLFPISKMICELESLYLMPDESN